MQLPKSQAKVELGNINIDEVNEAVPKMNPTTAAKLKITSLRMAANLPAFVKSERRIFLPGTPNTIDDA